MRIARKSIFDELFEFLCYACELIHFPGRSSVVIHQPEERLFFSALVAVEGPGENPLSAHHESKVCVHAASARCSVKAAAASSELVEPYRGPQCPFGHQRAK